MKNLNFSTKSGSQSGSHRVVTLDTTVGSPSAHRRGAMLKLLSVLVLVLTFGVGQMWGAIASGTYVLCTSTSDLEANAHYIIANGTSGSVKCISNVSNSNNRKTVAATVSSNKISVASNSTIMTFTLGGSSGAWTFHTDNYAGTAGYLASAASGNNNYCRVITTSTTGTISFSNNKAVINLNPHTSRTILRYNTSDLFACYSSGQNDVYLYKLITLSSIAVKTAPTKVSYTEGDNFDPSGLKITLTYSDNSTEDVTYNNTTASDFTFSPTTSASLTTSNTSVSITYGGKSTSQAITVAASAAPSYDITAQSNNTSYGTVSLSGSIITGSPKTYCRYASPAYTVTSGTATVSQNGNAFTVSPSTDCAITINFEPIPVSGVTMSSTTETLEVGGTVTLTATVAPNTVNPNVTWISSDPTVATVSNGTVTATQKAGTATITATSVGDNTKSATCTITVVPVASYKKVTAELTDWSGEYLLVYEPGNNKAWVWTGVDATSCYYEVDIPNSGNITKPATGVKLVLDALTGENDGKYSIKIVGGTNNGKYLDEFNASNATIKFTESAVPATVSYDGENHSTQFTTGNKYMRFNSANDQKRFRGYASNGQQPVQLYRKVVSSAVTITDPASGTGTLALANGQTAVASGDNVDAGTELTVTATPNAGNHYIGGTIVVKKTSDQSVVTGQVYNSTTGKITMPEYAITVSVTFTPTYAIVSASVTGGSFSWEETTGHTTPTYAAAGTQIQAASNATPGYVFGGTYDIYRTGASSTKVSHTNGLFTMPAYAVTIGGTFNQAPTINLSQTSTMAFTKVATGASTSAKFTVSAANLTVGSLSVSKSGTNADKYYRRRW